MEKEETGSWLLSQGNKLSNLLFFLVILFLPTQFGRHFWPDFAFIDGLRIDYLSPTLYLVDIFIILIFLIFFTQNPKDAKSFFNQKFLLFLVFLLPGIFISVSLGAYIYGVLKIFEFYFFAFYISKTKKSLVKIIKISMIPLLIEALISIVQFFDQSSLGGILYFLGERAFNSQTPGIANASVAGNLILRPYGTFSHPNVLAGYLLLSMAFILFLPRKEFKMIYFIPLAAGTIALFLTLSRLAILLWVFAIFLKIIISLKNKKTLIPLSLILIFSLIIFSPYYLRFNLNLGDQSITERIKLFQVAFEIFLKSPIFGVGVLNFLPNLNLVTNYHSLLQPVHNIYMLILTETGVLGFGFFIYILYLAFKKLNIKKDTSLFLVMVFLLILGFFDHYFLTLEQGQLFFSLVLGLCFVNSKSIV